MDHSTLRSCLFFSMLDPLHPQIYPPFALAFIIFKPKKLFQIFNLFCICKLCFLCNTECILYIMGHQIQDLDQKNKPSPQINSHRLKRFTNTEANSLLPNVGLALNLLACLASFSLSQLQQRKAENERKPTQGCHCSLKSLSDRTGPEKQRRFF